MADGGPPVAGGRCCWRGIGMDEVSLDNRGPQIPFGIGSAGRELTSPSDFSHHLRCMSENWFMSGTFDWASQLRHFPENGNYPSWKILAHARLKITVGSYWYSEHSTLTLTSLLRGDRAMEEWPPMKRDQTDSIGILYRQYYE
jgi:hypothetical protein